MPSRINHYAGQPRHPDTDAILRLIEAAPRTVAEIVAATGLEEKRVKRIIANLIMRLEAAQVGPRRRDLPQYKRTRLNRTPAERKAS